MIIASSAVSAGSLHSFQRTEISSLSVQPSGPGKQQVTIAAASARSSGLTLTVSAAAEGAGAGAVPNEGVGPGTGENAGARADGPPDYARNLGLRARARLTLLAGGSLPMTREELKLKMLESFLTALTGRPVSLRPVSLPGQPGRQEGAANPSSARGGQVTQTHIVAESESVAYSAQGIVKTADGKTIAVDVSLSMSRSFYQATHTALAPAGSLVDPLVINYGGTAASLTGQRFAFDLDADGKLEQIAFAGPGSGFLALDKDGDGVIGSGAELFGPQTGSGFGELRAYDADGNGWIDEADAVFSRLLVWSRDADGNDQLYTLKELGIGAIYLGDVTTPFTLADGDGAARGVMRSTSFFLRENGGAGTVSHIDLSV